MSRWFDRLHFLWEEEITPSEDVPLEDRRERSGVPRPLRSATRFALIGVVATSLMGQVIGVRLVAPVDAAPSYQATCVQACNDLHKADQDACMDLPPGPQRGQCQAAAAQKMQDCKASCKNGP
jgi:hypothetical protein